MSPSETEGPGAGDRPGRAWSLVRRLYSSTAIIWLNICLLLVLLNWIASYLNTAGDGPNPVVKRYGDVIYDGYPGWEQADVDQFINESYQPGYVYESYTQFRERPRRGEHVIVTNHGFRLHQPPGPWPPEPRFLNVFVFGGSTTFGYGLPSELGVELLFVWQPAPGYRYATVEHHLLGRRVGTVTWEGSYSAFEAALAQRAPDPGILNLAGLQENEERNLYVDAMHYDEYLSDRIAAAIAEHLVSLPRGDDSER